MLEKRVVILEKIKSPLFDDKNIISFLNYNRVIRKVPAKTPVCILKEESKHQTILCTKLFYAPKRDEKKFGPEYEATN